MRNSRNSKKYEGINSFSGSIKKIDDDKENIVYEVYDDIMNKKLNCNFILNVTDKDRQFGKDITNIEAEAVEVRNHSRLNSKNSKLIENKSKRTLTLNNLLVAVNNGHQGNSSVLKKFSKKETQDKINIPHPTSRFITNYPSTCKNRDVPFNSLNSFNSFNSVNIFSSHPTQLHTITNQYDKNLKINSFIRQKKKKNNNSTNNFDLPYSNNIINIITDKIELNTLNIIQKNAINCGKKSLVKKEDHICYVDEDDKGTERDNKNHEYTSVYPTTNYDLQGKLEKTNSLININYQDKENLDINVNMNIIYNENSNPTESYQNQFSLGGTDSVSTTNGTVSVHSQINTFNNAPNVAEFSFKQEGVCDCEYDCVCLSKELELNNYKENIEIKLPIKERENFFDINLETKLQKDAKEEFRKNSHLNYPNQSLVKTQIEITIPSNPESKYQINVELYEYIEDIFLSLKEEEFINKDLINCTYMNNQNEINEQMRAILIDWLIEVHSKFLLKPETLFVTVSIIDKYLSLNCILRSNLQLLGVCSMLVACKHEEIYTPAIRDFVYITDKAYTVEEVLEMEQNILRSLQFRILTPSSYRFFEFIAYFFKFNMREFIFGRYLLEISLIDYKMTKYPASIISCTVAYITMKFFKFSNYQSIYSNFFCSGTNPNLIKDCAKEICYLIDFSNDSCLTAAKRKFSKKEYFEVSNIIL